MKISDFQDKPFNLHPNGDALTSGEVLLAPETWDTDWEQAYPDHDAVTAIAKSALDDNDAVVTAVPVYDRKGYTSWDNFGEQHRNQSYNDGEIYGARRVPKCLRRRCQTGIVRNFRSFR